MDINDFVQPTDRFLQSKTTIDNLSDSINEDGSLNVTLMGFTLIESKTNLDLIGGLIVFDQPIKGIGIYNRDNNLNGIFIVNGIVVHAPPRVQFRALIGGVPSRTVIVENTHNFICNSYI